MTTVQLLIVCFTGITALLILCYPMLWKAHEYEDTEYLAQEKAVVVVNTLDQRSLRGVVLRSTKRYIELVETTYSEGGNQVNMSGVARVPASNVAFVQDVTPQNADYSN